MKTRRKLVLQNIDAMFSAVKVLVFGVLLVLANCLEDNVEEYEKLIKSTIRATETYTGRKNAYDFKPSSTKIKDLEDVDFIIVGSGAAGSVLGGRLSEISKWKILVLEAGVNGNEFSDIPAMQPYLLKTDYNWGFKSVPQKTSCFAYPDHVCPVPRGKAVGGTTIINGLRYVRGNKNDYNFWANSGNPEWNYKYVLPYFKKSENATFKPYDSGYHGTQGPLHTEQHEPLSPIEQNMILANIRSDSDYVDYNGKTQTGVSRSQQNTNGGRRNSAYYAFLYPALNRTNLKVYKNSYVTKVLIKPKEKEAFGVIFSMNKELYRVKAKKEVILSAGTISTPHLLMLSGIGPSDQLKKFGINVIQDLNVGGNFIDHPSLYGIFVDINKTVEAKSVQDNLKEYFKGYGQYTVATATTVLGFFDSSLTEKGYPDIEIYFRPPAPALNYTNNLKGFTDEAYDALYPKVSPTKTMEIDILMLRPESRGSVKLVSADPFDYPSIDFNFFSDQDDHDMRVMLEGIKRIVKLTESDDFRKMNASIVEYDLKACKGLRKFSDNYWKCVLKYYCYLGHHPMGTSKMGPNPAKGDVVDSKLKVHGIKNLRVVDASVILRVSGHTSAPTMMLAEKISDVIKLEHGIGSDEMRKIFPPGLWQEYAKLLGEN